MDSGFRRNEGEGRARGVLGAAWAPAFAGDSGGAGDTGGGSAVLRAAWAPAFAGDSGGGGGFGGGRRRGMWA